MTLIIVLLMLIPHLANAQETQNVEKEGSRGEARRRIEEQRQLGEKAIREARYQVATNPDSAEAHFNLAETLLKGPINFDEIMDEYLKAIELKPDYADAHYRLGLVYANKDKYQKGYDALNKAIQLKPDYAEAYCALGFAYIQKKFGEGHRLPRTEEESIMAVKAFKKAIQIKPDLLLAYNGLGEANVYLNQYNEALEAFKQAALLNPDDIISHMGMGGVYIELGNKDAAIQEHEALKRISSQLQRTYKEQGLATSPNLAESYAGYLLKQIQERFVNR